MMPPVTQDLPSSHILVATSAHLGTDGTDQQRLDYLDVISALLENGFKVTAMAEEASELRTSARAGAHIIAMPREADGKLKGWGANRKLFLALRENTPDSFLFFDSVAAQVFSPLARSFNRPYALLGREKIVKGLLGRRKQKKLYSGAKKVLPASLAMRESMIDLLGADLRNNSQMVYPTINAQPFRPDNVMPSRLVQIAQQWDTKENEPLILIFGDMKEGSERIDLISAFADMQDLTFRAIFLSSTLEANEKNSLLRVAQQQKVAHCVQFATNCRDRAAAMMSSDLIINCEQSPVGAMRICLEALSMGRPMMLRTDASNGLKLGLEEYVSEYPFAKMLRQKSHRENVNEMRTLLGMSADQRTQALQHGSRLIAKHHNPTDFANKIRESLCAPTP